MTTGNQDTSKASCSSLDVDSKIAMNEAETLLSPAPDSGAVSCAVCGCGGNMDCGHAPLDMERCCTLDAAEVCPCCRVKSKQPNEKGQR